MELENILERMAVPVGRSPWAIAAGYLGLLSMLAVPAPFAVICGVLAIRDIKKNPKKVGMPRAIFGIIMGVLFCALYTLMFLNGKTLNSIDN